MASRFKKSYIDDIVDEPNYGKKKTSVKKKSNPLRDPSDDEWNLEQ